MCNNNNNSCNSEILPYDFTITLGSNVPVPVTIYNDDSEEKNKKTISYIKTENNYTNVFDFGSSSARVTVTFSVGTSTYPYQEGDLYGLYLSDQITKSTDVNGEDIVFGSTLQTAIQDGIYVILKID